MKTVFIWLTACGFALIAGYAAALYGVLALARQFRREEEHAPA